jgi:putative restriction endonuclease
MMFKRFSDDSTNPGRALQIWQILIGKAHNWQTITYGALANMIGYSDARPLPNILGYIMKYCDQNNLPPLTALVVNKQSGAPGNGLTTLRNLDADREEVFNFDWYALVPPTPAEFRQVHN